MRPRGPPGSLCRCPASPRGPPGDRRASGCSAASASAQAPPTQHGSPPGGLPGTAQGAGCVAHGRPGRGLLPHCNAARSSVLSAMCACTQGSSSNAEPPWRTIGQKAQGGAAPFLGSHGGVADTCTNRLAQPSPKHSARSTTLGRRQAQRGHAGCGVATWARKGAKSLGQASAQGGWAPLSPGAHYGNLLGSSKHFTHTFRNFGFSVNRSQWKNLEISLIGKDTVDLKLSHLVKCDKEVPTCALVSFGWRSPYHT